MPKTQPAAYMAGRITQRIIDAVKIPTDGQILIRDGEVIGFILRVTTNGCKTWVWDRRIRGQMRRITIARYTDLSLNEARAEALKIRHEIAIGADPWEHRFCLVLCVRRASMIHSS